VSTAQLAEQSAVTLTEDTRRLVLEQKLGSENASSCDEANGSTDARKYVLELHYGGRC
jgi:hypothetical protein